MISRADALLLDAWLGEEEVQWDPGNVGIDKERQERLRSEASSLLEGPSWPPLGHQAWLQISVEANFVLADYYYRQQKVHDFRRHLTRIKIVDPNHLSRHYFEALSNARPLEVRLISWEELLINGPSQNRMRLKMVRFLLENKDYSRALQEVDVVLSKAPAHRFAARLRGHIVKLQTLEAEAAMAEKNEDASSDEVDEKLESPSVREQVQATPQLEVPQRNKRPRQKLSPLQTLLRKAAKSLDDGDPILAMKYCCEALVIKVDNIDALTGLGFCYRPGQPTGRFLYV